MSTGIALGVGIGPFIEGAAGEAASSTPYLDTNAVAFWKAKDYSGSGNWLDGSGNGHDAVPSGGVTFDTDHFVLDGVDGEFTVPDHSDLDLGSSEDITITVVTEWTGSDSGHNTLISKRNSLSSSSEAGYVMTILPGLDVVYFEVCNGTSEGKANGAGSLQADTVVAYHAVVAGNVASFYEDGDLEASFAGIPTDDRSNSVDFIIGAVVGSAYYDGDIYGVAVCKSDIGATDRATVAAELLA